MEGDLSLSQSLSGLRIANPDKTTSPTSELQATLDGAISTMSHPISLNLSESPTTADLILSLPIGLVGPSVSDLDFDPANFSTGLVTPTPTPSTTLRSQLPYNSPQSTPELSTGIDQPKSSVPLTYPAPQPSQFSSYPGTMPPGPRKHSLSSQPPHAMGTPGFIPSRDPSYRMHKAPSMSKLGSPQWSGSRGSAIAMQAGVPSHESDHNERAYRHGHYQGNGSNGAPPRRSSRGMASAPGSNGRAYPPGSSYSEGGPLPSSQEWKDRGAAMGMRQESDATGRIVQKYTKKGVDDFQFGRTLGEGSYSTVMLATDIQTRKEYAIKVLDKRHIIKEKKVKYVNIEKDTLNRLTEHPGVVRLYYTFQDERSLYFVLDVAGGGELLGVLKRVTTFDEECTKFYGAQMLDTIDYMHSRGVIHRDLKPENILMDDQMHLKITDFGTAKILDTLARPRTGSNGVPIPGDATGAAQDTKAVSFVGTAEYVSPELLTDKNACKASDLWAFGCIIYQLLAGRPPFKAANEYLTFQKIVALDYAFPPGFPLVARDLVERLLVLDPNRRLTIDHIKNHEFFEGIKWGRGLWKQLAPRLKAHTPRSVPIQLNGTNGHGNGNLDSYPADVKPSHSTKPVHFPREGTSNNMTRPSPRIITELPPPSQLDIEWSPMLTRNNERILKLGNLMVLVASSSSSPPGKSSEKGGEGSKFSRLFGGGGTTKKRQRLVMVTSSARILVAALGGDEKKSKFEISLVGHECSWKKLQDSKGLSYFCIDTRDKHYTFEDPKSASSDGSATAAAAQEWLDAMDRARDLAATQAAHTSFSGDDSTFPSVKSNGRSPANTPGLGVDTSDSIPGRSTLQKMPSTIDPSELQGFSKRFSKRQSKQGLAAVF